MALRRRAVIWWLLTLIWCGVIFGLTASQIAQAKTTRHVVSQVVKASPKRFEQLHKLVRKGAHVVVFAVLGALAWQAVRLWPAPRWACTWAWLLATLYAATDEVHQLMVPGRAGLWRDVLLDSAAAGAAVLLLTLGAWLRQRHAHT